MPSSLWNFSFVELEEVFKIERHQTTIASWWWVDFLSLRPEAFRFNSGRVQFWFLKRGPIKAA